MKINIKHYFGFFFIFFIISIGFSTYFAHYKYMNHNKENVPRYEYTYQTKIY